MIEKKFSLPYPYQEIRAYDRKEFVEFVSWYYKKPA